MNHQEQVKPFREYKSKKILFGLPLVHIVYADFFEKHGKFNFKSVPAAHGIIACGNKAKGIIAVGNFSAGFIAIGNASVGIISIGNISAGLFSLGNIALALLITIGNFAAGLLSLGNMALGYAATGNFAVGEYAVGNLAVGTFSSANIPFREFNLFLAESDAPVFVRIFYSIIEKMFFFPAHLLTYLFILYAIIYGIIMLVIHIHRKRKANGK